MILKTGAKSVLFGFLMFTLLMATLVTQTTPAFALSTSPAAVSAPQPLEPNKVITDTTPTYRWTQVSGASSYVLQVLKEYSNTVVYSYTVSSLGACYSGTCSYTPAQKLQSYGYRWRVRVSGSTIAWSPLTMFYIRATDYKAHHFTYGLMYHWQRKSGGTWWAQYDGGKQGYLVSEGLPDKCSAAVHYVSSTYDNFIAETKMMITGAPSGGRYPEAYLALRMKNNVNAATQCWYGGYLFGYSRDGKYSFWKMQPNGTWTALIPPTFTSLIKTSDWNNFKVSANKSNFYLFINGKPVGSVTDSSYSIGYLGFEMVNHGAVQTKFYADWLTIEPLP
ncbi:MAG TPA: hypothetical protein PK040_00215 [Anaerolineaceae bacterium]|nr:hypothetical protein [Anaerolineaceae bacterium]